MKMPTGGFKMVPLVSELITPTRKHKALPLATPNPPTPAADAPATPERRNLSGVQILVSTISRRQQPEASWQIGSIPLK